MIEPTKMWIPIVPVVKARPRLGRRRKAFTPQKTVDFENAVRKYWSENGPSYGDVPVGLDIEIHKDGFMVEVYELECSVRPVGILGDGDNYVKSIQDALQPHVKDACGHLGAFNNDRQVELLRVSFVGIPRKPKRVTIPKIVEQTARNSDEG